MPQVLQIRVVPNNAGTTTSHFMQVIYHQLFKPHSGFPVNQLIELPINSPGTKLQFKMKQNKFQEVWSFSTKQNDLNKGI
jgi:hypothetical protein